MGTVWAAPQMAAMTRRGKPQILSSRWRRPTQSLIVTDGFSLAALRSRTTFRCRARGYR